VNSVPNVSLFIDRQSAAGSSDATGFRICNACLGSSPCSRWVAGGRYTEGSTRNLFRKIQDFTKRALTLLAITRSDTCSGHGVAGFLG
jgi:hypothetical protein